MKYSERRLKDSIHGPWRLEPLVRVAAGWVDAREVDGAREPPRRRRCSHSDATLYILYRELLVAGTYRLRAGDVRTTLTSLELEPPAAVDLGERLMHARRRPTRPLVLA